MATDQNHVPCVHVPMQSDLEGLYFCWAPQVIRGEYVLNTLFGLERVWNGHLAQRQF